MKNIKLMRGDCLKLMNKIEDESIDMILADLPYEVTQNKLDIIIPFEPLWKHYLRLIKSDGVIVLFGQGLFYVDLVNSQRKFFRYDLVWDKELSTGFLNANRMPLRVHEQMAVFYKKLPTYNVQFSTGLPLHSKGRAYKNKSAVNQNYGDFKNIDDIRVGETKKYPTSILSFQKPHPSVAKHRTQKPVSLLEWLVLTYTNAGEIVLDNVMGSGSTGVACVHTSRKFIGIELDDYYFGVAKDWIYSESRKRG